MMVIACRDPSGGGVEGSVLVEYNHKLRARVRLKLSLRYFVGLFIWAKL